MNEVTPARWGFCNGEPLDCSLYATPGEFLLALDKGAYTGLMVQDGHLINWELHKDRLKRSVQILAEAACPVYPTFADWSREHGVPLEKLICDAIDDGLQGNWLADACRRDGLNSLMMVILARERKDPDTSGIKNVGAPGLDLLVYCKALTLPLNTTDVDVVLKGDPRHLPEAKYSQWVDDRQELEKLKEKGYTEVVLTSAGGNLLEGLTTNIFIVIGQDAELHTASVADGVLNGTMRRRVIAAATMLGIKIVEKAPSSASRDSWSEAFLTSSIAYIRPITRLERPGGKMSQEEPWERTFTPSIGPIISALMEELPKHQTMTIMTDSESCETNGSAQTR